jgi:DNA-binding Lrp family transcriptional regulator
MLNRLLELLQQGGTHRMVDLARELGTTPELVEMMLNDLCRMGYLKRVRGECSEECRTCPMADLCAAGSGGRLWVLAGEGSAKDS